MGKVYWRGDGGGLPIIILSHAQLFFLMPVMLY